MGRRRLVWVLGQSGMGLAAVALVTMVGFQNCNGFQAARSGNFNSQSDANFGSTAGKLTASDVIVSPGETARLTIVLAVPAASDLNVSFSTEDVSARAGDHYSSVSSSGVIKAGQKTFGVDVETTNTPGLPYSGQSFALNFRVESRGWAVRPTVTFSDSIPTVLKDLWGSVAASNAPAYFDWGAAAWTGSKVIFFGSDGGAGNAIAFARTYDPVLRTWSPISQVGAPSARMGNAAVWTGTKFIVWGGTSTANGNGSHFGDGGIYDPKTDTWSPMSPAGAPSARSGHSMVWTGKNVIVWGGYDGTSSLRDGAIYDVALDRWTPIPAAATTPAARSNHAAAWTGTKMIIWGGLLNANEITPASVYGDGAAFDPKTQVWVPIASANAPTARGFPAYAWTGTQMIVWGGKTRTSYLNTGAVYDARSDSWQAMTTVGRPSARDSAAGVWIGDQMLIYGGWNGAYLGDLWSYR